MKINKTSNAAVLMLRVSHDELALNALVRQAIANCMSSSLHQKPVVDKMGYSARCSGTDMISSWFVNALRKSEAKFFPTPHESTEELIQRY